MAEEFEGRKREEADKKLSEDIEFLKAGDVPVTDERVASLRQMYDEWVDGEVEEYRKTLEDETM